MSNLQLIYPAVIEMPQGTKYKYEADKYDGMLSLNRVINQRIPHNYGYIEDTLAEDGDPLDVFIISSDPIPPLTKVKCSIITALECIDKGEVDDKLIAIIEGDAEYKHANNSLIELEIQKILYYLKNYKTGFVVNRIVDLDRALDIIKKCEQAWRTK